MAFWVDFEGRAPGCVEAPSLEEARDLAKELTGHEVTRIDQLPYPANPRLNKVSYGEYGPCPSFCFTPTQCRGRGSCPKSYACSE